MIFSNDVGLQTARVSPVSCNFASFVLFDSATSMLVTDVGDENFKMLVTLSAILVTHILYLSTLPSSTNYQKMSPRS